MSVTGEGRAQRWRRRLLTFSGVPMLAALYFLALPLLLVGAALRDLRLQRRWITTRLTLFGAHYLFWELAGLVAGFGLWLASGAGSLRRPYLDWNRRLQQLWAGANWWAVKRLFDIQLRVEGEELTREGPLLVFVRHASLADTLLPSNLLRLRLRFVLKSELLWDPCLDVMGHRLPNVFVQRGSGEAAREIAAVRELAAGLANDEGVLIFPEGTRFNAGRRERALARVAKSGDAKRLERMRALRHLLPPRIGGPLALLQAAPGADVLLMGHFGFEGLAKLGDILDGGLVGRRIQVRYWRLPAASIPRGRDAQIEWLDACWARLDDWLEEQATSVPG